MNKKVCLIILITLTVFFVSTLVVQAQKKGKTLSPTIEKSSASASKPKKKRRRPRTTTNRSVAPAPASTPQPESAPTPPQPEEEERKVMYIVDAWEMYQQGNSYGYSSAPANVGVGELCGIEKHPNGKTLLLKVVASPVVGVKCDFILFGNKKLQNGFVFRDFNATTHIGSFPAGTSSVSVVKIPSAHSTSIGFKIHAWADPPLGNAAYALHRVTLLGPPDFPSWHRAFRP